MKRLIISILILSSVLFNGCVEKAVQSNKSENTKDCIVYNIGELPKELIMLTDYNVRQQDLLVNLFEGLVKTDEKGNIIPGISNSWTISKDETCYVFNIREDAKWSDGSDIVADDFVDFFSKILSKDINNKFADQLYYVFGAEEYRQGKREFNNVAIRAIDKKKLEIRLNYPCNYFLNILAEPIYSLRKINENLVDWKTAYKNILFTGSFIIDNMDKSNNITLVKNINYWNEDDIRSNKILLTCINSSEASLADFQSGSIDIFTNPPTSEVKSLSDSGDISQIPAYNTGSLVFNLNKDGIVKDVNFRKALACYIDRNYITKEILSNTARSALTYIPTGIGTGLNGQFTNKIYFNGDVEKDKALEYMKKSKFSKSSESLKMIYIDTVENKKICENISKNLRDNLDIKIECIGCSIDEFNDAISKSDYDLAKVDFKGSYDYPLPFLERYSSMSSDNNYGYKNIQFDTILEKSKLEKDKNKKIELLRTAENTLYDDVPLIPIYFSDTVICKKKNIKDVYFTKEGNIKLDKVYIDLDP